MKYIPIILVILIITIPAITLLTLRKEIGLKQTEEGKIIFFSGNQDYRFSFISPKENLNSVVIKLKNISIRNSKPVYFNLLEDHDVIKQIPINGSNIGDSSLIRFAFDEINNSKDKKYTVILSSPETQQNEALGVHTDNSDSTVIITYHKPSTRLRMISDTYKNFGIKILEDKVFIAIWLLLFFTGVFFIKSLKI